MAGVLPPRTLAAILAWPLALVNDFILWHPSVFGASNETESAHESRPLATQTLPGQGLSAWPRTRAIHDQWSMCCLRGRRR
mgnify:CR=1 FL=1